MPLVENSYLPIFRKSGTTKNQLDQLKNVLKDAINELDLRTKSTTELGEIQEQVDQNSLDISSNLDKIVAAETNIASNSDLIDLNAQDIANLISNKAEKSTINSLQSDLDVYRGHVDLLGQEAHHASSNIRYLGDQITATTVREALDSLKNSYNTVDDNLTTHKNEVTKHRVINDNGNTNVDLLSAYKILDLLSGKSDDGHNHDTAYRDINWTPVTQSIRDGYTSTSPSEDAIEYALSLKSDDGHNHDSSYRDINWVPDWTDVTSKPTFNWGYVYNQSGDTVIPESYLPSYVDDVIEGYYNKYHETDNPDGDNLFYEDSAYTIQIVGEKGKIYVDLNTNKNYRWGGSSYTYITSGAVDSVDGQTGLVDLSNSYEPKNSNIQSHISNNDKHRIINDLGNASTDLLSAYKIYDLLKGKSDSGHNHDDVYEPKDANIQNHISDLTKHRIINDSGTNSTELWSAYKINSMFNDFESTGTVDKAKSDQYGNVIDLTYETQDNVAAHVDDLTIHRKIDDSNSESLTVMWSANKIQSMFDNLANNGTVDSAIHDQLGRVIDTTYALVHDHPYDNYVSWSFAVNGVTQDPITSGDVLNFKAGENVSISRTLDDEITISSSYTDTWRDVIDNLTTQDSAKSLSANQGYVLKQAVDSKHPQTWGTWEDVYVKSGSVVIPNSYLPSYVNDVIEVPTYADLPLEGETGKIYVVVADEEQGGDTSSYRWTGSTYALVHDTMTANDILDLIKGVDGSGSGLDADKLDAQEGSYYLDWSNFTNVPTLDNYVKWLLQVNSGTTTEISSGEAVNFTGGGATSVSRSGNTITIQSTDNDNQLSDENVQDIVGAMVSSNSESNITVSYDDTNGKLNFSVPTNIYNGIRDGYTGTAPSENAVFDALAGKASSSHSHDVINKFSGNLPASWTASGDYFYADVSVSGMNLQVGDKWDIYDTPVDKAQSELVGSAGIFTDERRSTTVIRLKATKAVDLSSVTYAVDVTKDGGN